MTNISAELHREIMRRINNRYYENKDKCSLRRGGPGLTELAGLVPLLMPLPAAAVIQYGEKLAAIKAVLNGCTKCEGKLHAILYLVLRWADPAAAVMNLQAMCQCITHLKQRGGGGRDFLTEVLDAIRQDSGWRDPLILTTAGLDQPPMTKAQAVANPKPHVTQSSAKIITHRKISVRSAR